MRETKTLLLSSFFRSGCFALWDFVEVAQIGDSNLLRPRRRRETEGVSCNWRISAKLPDAQGVLRRAGDRLAGDDVFVRDRTGPGLDPDLPVGVGRPEREMLALDAIDHAATDMLCVIDAVHQIVIRTAHEQVRSRHGHAVLIPQLSDKLVERARYLDARVGILALAEQGRGLAVDPQLKVGGSSAPA